jgi:hypothetical protein
MLPSPVAPQRLVPGRRRGMCLILFGLVTIAGCGFTNRGLVAAGDAGKTSASDGSLAGAGGFGTGGEGGGAAGQGGAGARPADAMPSRTDGAPPADASPPAADGPRPVDVALPDARPPDLAPPDAAPVARALLLVGDQPPIAADGLLSQHLQGLGFMVRVLPVRNTTEADAAAAAAAGQQLVVLSNSMPQGPGLPGMIRDLPTPIICMKPAFLDNMSIGESPFGESFETSMAIAAPGHPMAAGRSGRVQVANGQTRMIFGRPLPSATVIATAVDDRILVTIFALERGAATPAGPTRGRRVGWMAQAMTINAFNITGWALFEAAAKWAAAPP